MDYKKMRTELRAANRAVPRSNEDLTEAYNAAFSTVTDEIEAIEEVVPNEIPEPVTESNVFEMVKSNVYTYIGAGDSPPHMIDYMGKQKFVRGVAVEVTNAEVLRKIDGNKCFVKGKVDMDAVFAQDKLEAEKAAKQREADQKLNEMALRIRK